MSITNVDRIGGFVVGNEANYNASAFGKSIFFAPNTKQLIVDSVKYIPKSLSELANDVGYLTPSALNTWQGTPNITTLGTITSGVWNGSPIVNGYLANSSISIAGESVALGGRINSTTLKEKLGLNNGPYLPLAGGDVTGNLNCYGNAYLGENLQVDGDVSFAGSSFNIDCKTTINSSLSVIGNVQAEELKIGDCTITYDSNNKCLMVDKGIASVSFVSAGGIEESSTIAELRQRVAQLEAQLISLTNKE